VDSRFALLGLALLVVCFGISCKGEQSKSGGEGMEISDVEKTMERLREHVKHLTVTIGERSVGVPENLEKTAAYIESFYGNLELTSQRESYTYNNFKVATIVANIDLGVNPTRHYILGAHYDSVWGTVGADDNASAIAVQLETARELKSLLGGKELGVGVKFVSFPLEEPPAFGTRHMASRIYAKKAKKENENGGNATLLTKEMDNNILSFLLRMTFIRYETKIDTLFSFFRSNLDSTFVVTQL
jgi:hypothetical protein